MSGLTWHGVRTVARQEFRLRLRAGRWRWLIGAWFVVLGILTALLVAAADAAFFGSEIADEELVPLGPTVFGFLALILVWLALLVVPALAAQSVNGDRDRGTLATLQVTLLSPAEIAVGKFLAAWGTALVFLATALPWVIWAVALGGVGVVRAVAMCRASRSTRTVSRSAPTTRRSCTPNTPGGCSRPTRSSCSATPRRRCRSSPTAAPAAGSTPTPSTRSGRSRKRSGSPGPDPTPRGSGTSPMPSHAWARQSGRGAWRSTCCSAAPRSR